MDLKKKKTVWWGLIVIPWILENVYLWNHQATAGRLVLDVRPLEVDTKIYEDWQ